MQHKSRRIVDGIHCIYDPNNVTVKKSYQIPCEKTTQFCKDLKNSVPYQYERSTDSWARELRAHNFLYELDLFVMHTEDTDLNDDEKWYRLLAYAALSFIYRIYSLFKKEVMKNG